MVGSGGVYGQYMDSSELRPDIEPSIDDQVVSVGSVTHSERVMPFDVQCLLSYLAGPAGAGEEK